MSAIIVSIDLDFVLPCDMETIFECIHTMGFETGLVQLQLFTGRFQYFVWLKGHSLI